MRFRIQAESPLPVTKAWFSCPEGDSITDLKKSLCQAIPAFMGVKTKPESLTLELDGFELLDILATGSIIREGDLIIVKSKGSLLGLKRKATPAAEKSAKKAKYTHSSSSSSSSNPSSSSSSESSSSDSSDSESGSSSDGPPIKKPIGRKPPQPLPSKATSNEHHVPPGQGSHQTRSRNLRRRIKKQHEQGIPFETPPPPPKNLSTTNLQPLGEPIGDSALNLSMFSLGNKNKKKGYKQALEKPATAKIIFHSDEPSSSISTPPPKSLPARSFPFNQQQRLIPPSERVDLPSNMFVTSVDVEAGMWDKKGKNKRKAKHEAAVYVEEVALDVDMANQDVSLDYGDPAPSPEELLWKDAEASFDSKASAASTDVQVGGVLAWKELALNPATFSPEIMLTLARVVALAEDGCTIRKLARPGYGEEEEEPLDEILSFGDMVGQSMRFIAS